MSEQKVIRSFAFEGNQVRVEVINDEPWWVVKDVLDVLGYAESSNASRVVGNVPERWKGVKPIHTLGGVQEILCLSEQGVYFFLGRSDKLRALPFQEWIAGEVLPSIRRTGKYSVIPSDPTLMGLPDFRDPIASAKAWLVEAEGRREAEAAALVATQAVQQLEAKVAADAPRVDFAAKVERAETTHLVGQLATFIQQGTKVPMGQNRLFKWLRKEGYLHTQGKRHNLPTQRSLDGGWIVVQTRTIVIEEKPEVAHTPLITGKGLLYFYKQFYELARMKGLAAQAIPPSMKPEVQQLGLPLWTEQTGTPADEATPIYPRPPEA